MQRREKFNKMVIGMRRGKQFDFTKVVDKKRKKDTNIQIEQLDVSNPSDSSSQNSIVTSCLQTSMSSEHYSDKSNDYSDTSQLTSEIESVADLDEVPNL